MTPFTTDVQINTPATEKEAMLMETTVRNTVNCTTEKEAMPMIPETTVHNTVNCTTEKEAMPMETTRNINDETVTIEDVLNEASIENKAANVREAIISRAAYVVAAKACPISSSEIRERVAAFLKTIGDVEIASGADVVLRREIDTTFIEAVFEDDKVILAWDVNPQAGEARKRPYVLWLHVKRAERPAKSQKEKFMSFMSGRCPDMDYEAMEAIFDAAWDGERIVVRIFPKATPVVLASKENKAGSFLLQKVTDDGRFVPNRPIAYYLGNQVWVSIPGTEKNGRWVFHS